MLRMLDLVAQVAPSRSTILITGETGTGKELIAKAIHANSPRAEHAFVPVNSGSLPPDLLESDAVRPREGRVHQRDRRSRRDTSKSPTTGTIFFDEIGTIRLGDADQAAARDSGDASSCRWARPRPIKVDVRILAATNADLKQAGGGRQVPRGSVLPAERDQSSRCRRCASARKIFPRWWIISSPSIAARTRSSWTSTAARGCASSRRRCRC